MRLKINGYILLFTRADHEGRHIHLRGQSRVLSYFSDAAHKSDGSATHPYHFLSKRAALLPSLFVG